MAGYGKEISGPVLKLTSAADQVRWLEQVARLCRDTASLGSWGIFGTSNVASWIKGEVGIKPDFYIDEDVAKHGQMMEGVEILIPKMVPECSNVLMAMAPSLAESIMNRFKTLPVKFISLPPISVYLNSLRNHNIAAK